MTNLSRWLVRTSIATLMILQVALFFFATLVTDSGRDLANAYAVGHGGPYPLYGPGLFGHWKLGPVWFYVLALPLKVFGSVTAASVFVGFLASLKIPLAYLLGKRLFDERLGILAAVLISLPGWTSVGSLVVAHVSVVETTMLATALLSLVAWQEQRVFPALAAALMLSLAIHAHPTALIMAPAVVLAVVKRCVMTRRWLMFLLSLGIFLLPFLPALWAEMLAGWPQVSASAEYLRSGSDSLGARLARVPALIWALSTGGVWLAGHFLLPWTLGVMGVVLQCLLLIFVLLGYVRWLLRAPLEGCEQVLRRFLPWFVAWTLASVIFIAMLRDATPAWMVYSLSPFGVFLVALGILGLLLDRPGAWRVIASVGSVAIAVSALVVFQRVQWQAQGRVLLPGASVGDIAASRSISPQYSPWLSVRQFDDLAVLACKNSLTLHGELAATFDFSQGVAAQLHCGQRVLPRLGGNTGGSHLVGISAGVADALGFTPRDRQFGHEMRTPLQLIASEQGREAAVDVMYRLDRQAGLNAQGETHLQGQLSCSSEDVIAVTNLMPMLNRMEVRLLHNGEPLQPRAGNFVSQYYACEAGEIIWSIVTPDPASVDMVVVSRQ